VLLTSQRADDVRMQMLKNILLYNTYLSTKNILKPMMLDFSCSQPKNLKILEHSDI
jgi:hypothetical protein